MKNNLLYILYLIPVLLVAQKTGYNTASLNFSFTELETVAQEKSNEFFLIDENTVDALAKTVTLPSGFSLVFKKQYASVSQIHYRYQLHYNNVEVFMGEYHFVLSKKSGELTALNYTKLPLQVAESFQGDVQIPTAALSKYEKSVTEKQVYYPKNDQLIPAVYTEVNTDGDNMVKRVYSQSEWLYQQEAHVYHHQQGPNDTSVTAYVFNPDPLTTSLNTYGGAYVDSSDSRVLALEAQRVLKPVVLTKDLLGSILMENDAAILNDFAAPFSGITLGSSSSFQFSRDEDGFEDMNVLYHLLQQYNHLQTLGFSGYPGYRIPVDPHGLSGSDNSRVNISSNPPSMEFGEGGVDDAEDADVIVHEYNHALQFSFTGTSSSSAERGTIEEGLADYFCVSYSRNINPFNSTNVFGWDGHNEYWAGRSAISSKNYKTITFGNDIYEHTDMFVACLLEIYDSLGRDMSDQLIWEAMFSLNPNTTMPQFALATLDANTSLNGGANTSAIRRAFVNYGILEEAIGLDENGLNVLVEVSALNLFAKGAYALFKMSEAGELKLYTSNGALIETYTYNQANTSMKIVSTHLKAGIYFLQAHTKNGLPSKTTKLIKF